MEVPNQPAPPTGRVAAVLLPHQLLAGGLVPAPLLVTQIKPCTPASFALPPRISPHHVWFEPASSARDLPTERTGTSVSGWEIN